MGWILDIYFLFGSEEDWVYCSKRCFFGGHFRLSVQSKTLSFLGIGTKEFRVNFFIVRRGDSG
jgi:hypothetical protein